MTRRLFLHIGTMKSGTTYVQGLLEENRRTLADRGLLWPTAELRYRAVRQLLGTSGRPGDGAWRTVSRQLARHDGDAVFSNELLAALEPDQISALVGSLPAERVTVIVTARHLARVVPSHWQSKVKDGWTLPWRDFAAAVCGGTDLEYAGESVHDWFWHRHDVAAILRRWSTAVPTTDSVVVTVPFESSRARGQEPDVLARRFAEAIGHGLGDLRPAPSANRSLGAWSAELLRVLNAQQQDAQQTDAQKTDARQHEAGHRAFSPKVLLAPALIATSAAEPSYGLSAEQAAWVLSRAGRMRAEIEGSGVAVVGGLDELDTQYEVPRDLVDPATASDSQLLAAAKGGIVGMIDGVLELRTELAAAEREVRRTRAAVREAAHRPPPGPSRVAQALRRLRRAAGRIVRRR